MKNMLPPIAKVRMLFDRERCVISRMLRNALASGGVRTLLDVGCGYGRNLRHLRGLGLRVVGVDTNPDAVEHNRALGLECYLPEETGWRQEYDCILMSHIIEHFSPPELVRFMEDYLTFLRPGGHLVIATPLLTDYFFDDFTHIRPYHPESILMVFGDINPQVRIRSEVRLELRDLWFRSSAYKIRWVRMRYLGRFGKAGLRLLNGLLALLHFGSFGLLGRKDGWVGVFRKVG